MVSLRKQKMVRRKKDWQANSKKFAAIEILCVYLQIERRIQPLCTDHGINLTNK